MKSILCAFATGGLSALAVFAGVPDGSVVIAERGKTSAWAIVLPKEPRPSERRAAEELRDGVQALTGVCLPIADDWAAKAVRIDRAEPADKLGDEGFSLAVQADGVHIRGGVRGVLYGAGELLETYGGIAWLTPDLTDVPETGVFSVPADLSVVERPAFARRCHDWGLISQRPAFATRSRENHFPRAEEWGGSHPTFDRELGWCHTFYRLVNPKEHFDGHPEYFAQVDGTRRGYNAQLCLSNPDVIRIVTEKVLSRVRRNLREKSPVKYYGVSQNDCEGFCTCPSCKAIDDAEGSPAGSVIRFVNRIAEEVEKVDPEAVVETLAYMSSRRPPKHVRPRHNVMTMLCSFECEFSKPMSTSRYAENERFRRDVGEWREISRHLMIWDYTANWRVTPCPQHNLSTLRENARFYRDNGVTELFYEGWNDDSPATELGALKGWLSGKLMWNPDRPLRPLTERFVRGYYGKGAPQVMRYIDLLERQPIDETKTPFTYRTLMHDMPWSDRFLRESQALWRKAYEAVRGSSPQIVSNVYWGAFGANYARLAAYMHRDSAWKPFVASHAFAERIDRGEFEEMRALGVRLAKVLERNPDVELSSRLFDYRYKGYVRAMAASVWPEGAAADRTLIQEWALANAHYPSGRTVFYERDAQALDGWSVRACRAGRGWQLLTCFEKMVALDEDANYGLRARVKVKPGVPGGDPPAVRIGLFDRSCKKDVFVSEVGPCDEYDWKDLGSLTVKGGDYVLYIVPGDAELWVDCIEVARMMRR